MTLTAVAETAAHAMAAPATAANAMAAHATAAHATAAHATATTAAAGTHGFLSPTGVEVAFLLVGLATFGAALVTVTTRQLVHAALWLVVTLGGLAVEYLLLTAEFIAWVQVLIYVGSVVVLLLFGLMLTKAPIGRSPDADSGNRWAALTVAVAAAAALVWVVIDAFRATWIDLDGPAAGSTAVTGASLFQNWVLPFEALSVLLLAALVGAIVLSRKATAEMSSPCELPSRDRQFPFRPGFPDSPGRGTGPGRAGRRPLMHLAYPAVLSSLLFCTGLYGVLARRNAILVLMSVELMLNAVNLNLVAFDVWLSKAAQDTPTRPGPDPVHHRHRRRRDRYRPRDRPLRLPQPRHLGHRQAPRQRRGPRERRPRR